MTGKTPKRPRDPNQLAKLIVDIATGELTEPERGGTEIKPGRAGGLTGGRARAEKLSEEERSEIARNAAKARWEAKT